MSSPRGWLSLALCLPLGAGSGCYQIGYRPAPGLGDTIAVPVFVNQTLRRDLELTLTRHVRRELLETTPLHLASAEALGQPVLRGTIASVREGVLVAGPAEEVIESSLAISVTFGVYRGGRLILGEDLDADGAPDSEIALDGFAELSLPRGESREGAADEVLRDLAEMIVARLSDRGDDRFEPNDEPARATAIPLGRQVALRQRDEDWFRVLVPPGKALEATLSYSGPDGLVLRAAGSDGQFLRDARSGADGVLTVPPAAGERTVLLRVTGEDEGRPYQLALRLR